MVKLPPAYTVDPLTPRAETLALELGFQALTAPVVAFSATKLLRDWPPTTVKVPPAYTTPPLSAIESTLLLALLTFGFQAETTPVVASRAPIRLRAWPPMVVKKPPA